MLVTLDGLSLYFDNILISSSLGINRFFMSFTPPNYSLRRNGRGKHACSLCRKKKVKCDGNAPCSMCIKYKNQRCDLTTNRYSTNRNLQSLKLIWPNSVSEDKKKQRLILTRRFWMKQVQLATILWLQQKRINLWVVIRKSLMICLKRQLVSLKVEVRLRDQVVTVGNISVRFLGLH